MPFDTRGTADHRRNASRPDPGWSGQGGAQGAGWRRGQAGRPHLSALATPPDWDTDQEELDYEADADFAGEMLPDDDPGAFGYFDDDTEDGFPAEYGERSGRPEPGDPEDSGPGLDGADLDGADLDGADLDGDRRAGRYDSAGYGGGLDDAGLTDPGPRDRDSRLVAPGHPGARGGHDDPGHYDEGSGWYHDPAARYDDAGAWYPGDAGHGRQDGDLADPRDVRQVGGWPPVYARVGPAGEAPDPRLNLGAARPSRPAHQHGGPPSGGTAGTGRTRERQPRPDQTPAAGERAHTGHRPAHAPGWQGSAGWQQTADWSARRRPAQQTRQPQTARQPDGQPYPGPQPARRRHAGQQQARQQPSRSQQSKPQPPGRQPSGQQRARQQRPASPPLRPERSDQWLSGQSPVAGPATRRRPRPAAAADGPEQDRTRRLISEGRSNGYRASSSRRRSWAAAAALLITAATITAGVFLLHGSSPAWPAGVARVQAEVSRACASPDVASEPGEVNFACAPGSRKMLWIFALLTSGDNPAFGQGGSGRQGLEPIRPSQGGVVAWSLNLHHAYDPANPQDSISIAARAINNIIAGATVTSPDGHTVIQPGLEGSAANCERFTGSAALRERAGYPTVCARPVSTPAGQASLVSAAFQAWTGSSTVAGARDAGVLFRNAGNPADPQVEAILHWVARHGPVG